MEKLKERPTPEQDRFAGLTFQKLDRLRAEAGQLAADCGLTAAEAVPFTLALVDTWLAGRCGATLTGRSSGTGELMVVLHDPPNPKAENAADVFVNARPEGMELLAALNNVLADFTEKHGLGDDARKAIFASLCSALTYHLFGALLPRRENLYVGLGVKITQAVREAWGKGLDLLEGADQSGTLN